MIENRKTYFIVQWKNKFALRYFSLDKAGWFCKICLEYYDFGDHFRKTLPRKHQPHLFFTDHIKSSKNVGILKGKQEIK